jgi:hypothetical protein
MFQLRRDRSADARVDAGRQVADRSLVLRARWLAWSRELTLMPGEVEFARSHQGQMARRRGRPKRVIPVAGGFVAQR